MLDPFNNHAYDPKQNKILLDYIGTAVQNAVTVEIAKHKLADINKVQLRMECLSLATRSNPHGSNDVVKIATQYENYALGITEEKPNE